MVLVFMHHIVVYILFYTTPNSLVEEEHYKQTKHAQVTKVI